jgi:hypothetical protein
MWAQLIRGTVIVASLVVSVPLAQAAAILDELAPTPTSFAYPTDFLEMIGTGFGDVTAPLFAVDLLVPSPAPSASNSGCEAADFAGFVPGDIALIQRGTCSFATKVLNAEAAGAAAVLIFNEGNPGRTDVIAGTLLPSSASVVVFGTSFSVGDQLRNGVLNGPTGVTAHVTFIPEPATLALLCVGLGGLAASRRRKLN